MWRTFCSDLSAATTKKLGLTRNVSDSTAYRMVKHQKPEGLRESVKAQVLQMAKDKVIKRDRLEDGVASFDGKEFFNSTTHGVGGAKVSVNEKLLEDDVQPCQHTKESLTVVCCLRMMGCNMVSVFRARAPKKDRKPQPWKRTMDKLRDALCVDVKEDTAPIV